MTTVTPAEGALPPRSVERPPQGPSAVALPVRGRRRPWLVALGAFLAAVGALAVVWLVGAAGQRVEVVVVRQEVPYGQQVTDADLGLARVSVDPGVLVVRAAERATLVGQSATTTLVPGTLLSPGMVAPSGEPASGRVLVPLALPVERMPAGGLRPGDRVLAVETESSESAPVRPYPAVVVRVGEPDVNGVAVVDVTTSPPDGPGLTVAAAQGRIALVVQPSRS